MDQARGALGHLFKHNGAWQAHRGMGRPCGLWEDTRQLHAGLTSYALHFGHCTGTLVIPQPESGNTTARPLSKPSLYPSRSHRQTQEAILHLSCFHGRFSLQSMRCGSRAYLEKPESRQGGDYATI